MKTNEILKDISELKFSIDKLDDPEFIQEQGLTPEDIAEVRKQFDEQIKSNKEAVEEKLNYILQLRRKKLGYISGNLQEIQSINLANESHKKEIENIDRYIYRVCKALGSDTKNKLSVQNGVVYLGKKSKKTLIDEKKLPFEMFRLKDLKLELNPDNRKEKLLETMFKRELEKDGTPIAEENIKVRLLVDVLSLKDDLKKRLIEDGIMTEENLSKKEPRTQKEIQERYDKLSEEEKKKYDGLITVVDNEYELKLDEMKA